MIIIKIKKQKAQNLSIKEKIKLEDFEHCLQASQLKNKINQLKKNKVDVDRLRQNRKEMEKKTIN